MKKSILALASASLCLCVAGLAQAQTFPKMTPNPVPFQLSGNPSSSAAVNLTGDYLILQHVVGNSLTPDGLLPMSAFAGSADVAATNSNLATTNSNLTTTNANVATANANLATTNGNLATTNSNLAATNANLLGLRDYAIGVRNLALAIRKEARQSAAAAMAISTAPMPSAPGRTSWTVNAAEFNGEPGWGGSVAHRFNAAVPFAVTAGFAVSGANNGGRVGFAGEF